MTPRLRSALLLAAAAALTLTACGSSEDVANEPDSPESAETSQAPEDTAPDVATGDGYTYAVPEGWADVADLPEAEAADTFVRSEEPVDDFATNINVIVTPAPGVDDLDLDDPELEQLRSQLAASTEQQTGTPLEPVEDTELDGSPTIGHAVEEFDNDGRTLTLAQYVTVRDETSYVITLTAAAADADAADAALQSVLETWTWE